jgi:SAM-dependent MidA family methyltransferase
MMTERDLRKLEGTIRTKMEDIKKQRVSLKDSGIGGLMNALKKADEALYDKILPEYKKMASERNIFK